MSEKPNVVVVHGAWADGSSWSDVIESLQAAGFTVTAPQFPETSLAADVARLRQVLRRQKGPTVVAGHSYGGRGLPPPRRGAPAAPARGHAPALRAGEGGTPAGQLAWAPATA